MGPDGLPMAAAFEIRPGEDYLSVNWLEYFNAPDLDAAIERVREAFDAKGYRVRPNGRFAVVGVGAAKAAIAAAIGQPGSVEHLPLDDDQSHAGLYGYPQGDLAAAAALRARVQQVHPAVPSP